MLGASKWKCETSRSLSLMNEWKPSKRFTYVSRARFLYVIPFYSSPSSFLSFPFLFFLCLMKHYIYLSPVYEHSFFVKSSQSDVKWNERRVNGFPVIWSEIMGDNWGNEQWNYRVNLSRGNGWILIEFLQFVIFETCYKNWGKSALSFFYAIPSEVDNSHLFLSFFFFL